MKRNPIEILKDDLFAIPFLCVSVYLLSRLQKMKESLENIYRQSMTKSQEFVKQLDSHFVFLVDRTLILERLQVLLINLQCQFCINSKINDSRSVILYILKRNFKLTNLLCISIFWFWRIWYWVSRRLFSWYLFQIQCMQNSIRLDYWKNFGHKC